MKNKSYQITVLLTFLFFCITFVLSQQMVSNDVVRDVDGNLYKTIKIGKQLWMAENLKVIHYRNGDPIPNHTDDDEWDTATGAYCNYDNDEAKADIYGRLYNWFALNDSRKLAPEGWRVPTDDDWRQLVEFLGGEDQAGGKMKTNGTIKNGDGLWHEPNAGATNESGFSALPGGYRYNHGVFDGIGNNAYFWSSTQSSAGTAWHRYLYNGNTAIYRHDSGWKQAGYSIRCVAETPVN
jgi:uncharacterized protein (TIGR02145 family)